MRSPVSLISPHLARLVGIVVWSQLKLPFTCKSGEFAGNVDPSKVRLFIYPKFVGKSVFGHEDVKLPHDVSLINIVFRGKKVQAKFRWTKEVNNILR